MSENTSEWDFFKRIEELEKGTKGIKQQVDEEIKKNDRFLSDAFMLGLYGFLLGFHAAAPKSRNPRRLKDNWIAFLKKRGVSAQALGILEKWMTALCEAHEE